MGEHMAYGAMGVHIVLIMMMVAMILPHMSTGQSVA